jgi:PAS domain S-box-containing protein
MWDMTAHQHMLERSPSDLRDRAIAALSNRNGDLEKPSANDMHALVEELQLHQIELQMQNDELRQAQAELEASRDRYNDLYDFAPVGYMTLNAYGFVVEANQTSTVMLKTTRSDLLDQPLSRFIAQDDRERFYLFRHTLVANQAPQSCELKLVRKDTTRFYASLETMLIEDGPSNTLSYRLSGSGRLANGVIYCLPNKQQKGLTR